jgi:hypothetical protein
MKNPSIHKKIVKTASELFYQNGYSLTGVNEIIKKSGVAKATFYNHFQSKENLCISYLKYKNNLFLSALTKFVEVKPSGEIQVLAIFDFLNKLFQNKEFNGCWCINTISEIPKENEKIRTEIQFQKTTFLKHIGTIINNNYISKTEKENKYLAQKIYLLYESAVTESHLHQNEWPILVSKDMCSNLLKTF